MTSFDALGLTVYVDGEFVSGAEARVSVFDHGLLYGDGVFEGMRVFSGALFRPREHLARLERSGKALMLDIPLSSEDLLEVIAEVVSRSTLSDAHVRVMVTRGFGAPGLDPWRCEHPTVIVAAYPFPPVLGERPVRLLTSSIVRKSPRSLGAHVKSLNYLDSIMAKQQATMCGMDEAIMLDLLGAVAECTGANLFLIVGDMLITPTTRAALPGITRQTVLELAAELGIPAEERDVWPMEVYGADGAFVTGSGAGIVPVAEVDGRSLDSAKQSIFICVRDAYYERTKDPRFTVQITRTTTSGGAPS